MDRKTFFIPIFITLFLSNNSIAKAQYFEGGAIVGFTVSQIDGDLYGGYHQPGLTGGFFTYRQFSQKIKAQLELKYIAKGARETGSKDDPMEYSMKLRYVEVPVKINYLFDQYKISIETGIGIGYKFHQSGEFNGSLLEEPYNKTELDWLFGINYNINKNLSVSAQFNYSLLPVRKYENSDYNYGFLSRTFWMTKGDYNNIIQFLVYYKFSKN